MQSSMLLVSNLMKLSLPPGSAAGKERLLRRVEWMAEAEAICGEPRMAVGVNVPDAIGWSVDGGVRNPLATPVGPLDDGCRDRKLEVLGFGERVLGVEEEPEAKGSGAAKLAGDEAVGEAGSDSERTRVK